MPFERPTSATSTDGYSQDHTSKASAGHPSLLTYWLAYRLTQRPGKRLCAQEGRCVYFLPRGFPEPGDRDKGLSPSGATLTCAHVYMFSWQHPLWGEASTCPIPEQGAGVAHPQVNRPDSGEKNEGREATAGQVALLGSWHPPASPLLLSLPPLASSKQESGCLEALGLKAPLQR